MKGVIELKYECVNPPIPLRGFVHSVTKKEYDMGDYIAYGETERQALENYLEWYADRNNIGIEEIIFTIDF